MLLSLHQTTLNLLHNRPRTLTYEEIIRKSEQLGCETKLTMGWLVDFSRGHFVDPSVNRVEMLYLILSGKNELQL